MNANDYCKTCGGVNGHSPDCPMNMLQAAMAEIVSLAEENSRLQRLLAEKEKMVEHLRDCFSTGDPNWAYWKECCDEHDLGLVRKRS